MTGLGFGCGIPYPLVGSTFGLWLISTGASLGTVAMASWLALPYALKPFWLPFIESRKVPILSKLFGSRRDWILTSQIAFIIFIAIATFTLANKLGNLSMLFILLAATAAATQDAFVDGLRIDAELDDNNNAVMLRNYSVGYKIGFIFSQSVSLLIASHVGWSHAYLMCTCLMVLPIVSTICFKKLNSSISITKTKKHNIRLFSYFTNTISFTLFVGVALYRLPDLIVDPIRSPFLLRLGMSIAELGKLQIVVGVPASFAGIFLGGLLIQNFDRNLATIIASALQTINIAIYAVLAFEFFDERWIALAIGLDGIASGATGIVLVSVLSDLVRPGQGSVLTFAMLTSCYALVGKLVRGFSGYIIDLLSGVFGASLGFGYFFLITAFVGIPAITLINGRAGGTAED